MSQINFDDDAHMITNAERDQIESIIHAVAAQIRSQIPLPDSFPVIVSASTDVLPTGDNAFTDPRGVIRWWADPRRDIAAIAQAHLGAAVGHEAYHLTRFTRLGGEAGDAELLNIAVNEGLATAFARDLTGITEPWGSYDPAVASDWVAELERRGTVPESEFLHWKFLHPDGREWIAFRAGTWLVDQLREHNGTTAAELVHVPIGTILSTFREL